LNWLDIASLPLAAIVLIAVGWVINHNQKSYISGQKEALKMYMDSAIKPLQDSMKDSVASMREVSEANTGALEKIVTNHLEHDKEERQLMRKAIEKLCAKFDDN